jgi:hypothetical protein
MSEVMRYYRLRESSGDPLIKFWLIKIVGDETGAAFDAYVGVDAQGRVVERSRRYGVFEGNAANFAEDSGASEVGEQAFQDAWNAPRVKLSLRRRFLQRLNGVDDRVDPSVRRTGSETADS